MHRWGDPHWRYIRYAGRDANVFIPTCGDKGSMKR